jgi:peptidoglycan/LPS O-acetylase OafA/YrhL
MPITQTTKLNQSIYFENLNGFRTIAFLMVFLQHSFFEWMAELEVDSGLRGKSLKLIFQSGGLGVSAFFVLSGFLITYLLIQEKENSDKINVWYFYMRRLLRIWPLYYAILIYGFIIYPYIKEIIGMHISARSNVIYYISFLSNFDLISNERMLKSDPQIAVTWSVAIEEQFYLVWPLLFSLIKKAQFKWIFITIIIGCQIFRFFNRTDDLALYFHSLSVVSDLALGGLAAYFAFYSQNFKNLFIHLNRSYILLVYAVALLWIVLGNSILSTLTFNVFGRLITTLLFAFIILEQCFSIHSFYKFSNQKTISFLGKYTFGMYLMHMIALRFVGMIASKVFSLPINYLHANLGYTISRGIISLIVTILISYLSFEYFEQIFLRFKHRFTTKQYINPARVS